MPPLGARNARDDAMNRGLILLAHGARDPSWAAPFEAVAARVSERAPEAEVRLAFLELMAPALADAGADLVRQGCARIDVVPVFLGMGGHVRRDVPAQLEALRARHPGVDWHLHAALGEAPRVIAALADAALAATGLPLPTQDKTPR
jgi:sirohydrochlorin cobaltochelatase